MNTKVALMATLVIVGLSFSPLDAAAETAKVKAIKAGAKQLTSEEIANRIVGKTVTAISGKKRFLFHYSTDNVISGKLIGGKWADSGYYGITDDNRVCLSMRKSDKGRLRCMTLLLRNGVVKKYRADGSLSFTLLKFSQGKTF